MIEFRAFGIHWRLSLLFPAMLTTLLLWQPDSLAIPCVLASLVHEGGHLLAMWLVGVRPRDFSLGVFGAQMHMDSGALSYKQGALISLFGPVANIFCAGMGLLCHRPLIFWINVLMAGINLLPAKELDGGELLYSCLCWSGLDRYSSVVVRISSACVLFLIAVIGFSMLFNHDGNGSMLIIGAYLVVLLFFADKCEQK